ncbi:MAG: peptidylprolyl isomerase [bacterium]|nr:peptidylprolyl isomerase [bacterium]
MLKYMRNNLKVIMWIIIGAFLGTIFVSWGMGGIQQQQNIAAKINGTKIPLTEYYEILNRYYDFYRKIYGKNFSPELLKKLNVEKMAMDQVIKDTIIDKKAEELGLSVSDEEVVNYIKSFDIFQTDGKFDPRKFSQASQFMEANGKKVDWIEKERQVRKDIIRKKMEEIIKDGITVSDKEIEFRYLYENEEIKASYIFIDPKAFLTEKKIKEYYSKNEKQFEEPEKVKASHILFMVKNSDNATEEREARNKAEKVMAEIKKGQDFAKLAKTYSEDSSKEKGGDLGYFSRGTMDANFERAAFALKIGEVSQIIRSEYGFHIIKLLGRKEAQIKPFEEVKENIKYAAVTDEEKNQAKKQAEEISKKILAEKDLSKSAGSFKIPVINLDYFNRSKFISGIYDNKKFKEGAFKLSKGSISPLIETEDGFYFIKLLERKQVNLEKFTQTKDELKNKILQEKKDSYLENWFEDIRKKSDIKLYINPGREQAI